MALSTIPTRALSEQGINFRNLIINGDMSVAQRGTTSTGITSTAYYTLDRMRTNISALGTWTQSQSTDVPTGQGFAYSLKMDCTTADASPSASDYLNIEQRLEGQNLQHLKKGTSSAESLTLSFWVKSNKTGTYIAEIIDTTNDRNNVKGYTINSANTWEKKTLTYSGDTTGALTNNNGTQLRLSLWLGAGSDYTSGTLQSGWGARNNANRLVGQVNLADSTSNEWYITGVQLEVGTSASDFEFLPFDVNYQRCKRYYEKTYAYETAPGTNTTVGNIRFSGSTDGGSNMVAQQEYSVEKRATPTQTYYQTNGTSGSWGIARNGATSTATANNWEQSTKRQSAYFDFQGGITYQEGHVFGHWTADAEL